MTTTCFNLLLFRMTLLLGPPGSGKTTFLLALAGKLDPKLKVRTLKKRRYTHSHSHILSMFTYLSIVSSLGFNVVCLHSQFAGKVTYNGHAMNEFVPQRTAAYVDQNDLHMGEMTVRETLAFSARVQGVGARYG